MNSVQGNSTKYRSSSFYNDTSLPHNLPTMFIVSGSYSSTGFPTRPTATNEKLLVKRITNYLCGNPLKSESTHSKDRERLSRECVCIIATTLLFNGWFFSQVFERTLCGGWTVTCDCASVARWR